MNTNTVTIVGTTYIVVATRALEDEENDGNYGTVAKMAHDGVSAYLTLRTPRGRKSFKCVRYNDGGYGPAIEIKPATERLAWLQD